MRTHTNIWNLNDGVKEANLQMRSFGEEVPKSLSDLLAKTDISTKQMQEWGKSVVAGGKEGAQAMGEVSDWLQTIEDDSLRNALAVAVFGTKAEDQGDNMIKIFQGVADAQDKTVQNQQTLQEAINTINADALVNIREALIKIVEALKPVLIAIAEFAAKIAEWVSNNAALTAAIVAIVAVVGILAGAFAALMPAIGGLVTAWPALVALIGAIASPITLVVAAIVGLGVALVAAYQNSETFRENVNNVFQAIRDVAVTVFETVASFISEKISQIKQFWDTEGAQILQAVQNIFNGIKAVIEFVMPAVKLIIETVWNAIKQVIDGALNIIMGLIKTFSGLFTGDFSKMWEGVKQIFKGAIDLVVGWMTLSFFGGIKTIVTNLAKTGVSLLKGMWDDIAKFFTSMGSKVSSTVSNFSTSVLNFFKNLATNTGSTISNMVSSVINFVKNLATNFVNIISTMKNNVLNKMTEIKDGLINRIKSLPEQFTGIGKDIINGLIKGISAMTANAIESITGVVDGVVNTAKKLLGIHSPSREFMKIGLWTGEGMVIGLNQSAPKVNAAMENIGNGILAVSKSYQEEYSNLIDEFNKKNEDKNDKTLEKIYKIQNNAAKKKRKLTQQELQEIALLEASYRDNKMKSEIDFQKKYRALVEKSEKEYLEVIKNYIADKKSLDELSLVEEAAIWEQSIELFAEGTRERITAQKEYQKAVEDINKQIVSINSEYQSKIQTISDNLIKQEEEATKAYTDALKNREQVLKSYAGTFDEFKIDLNRTGLELMTNLQGQVDGFKQWQAEFEKLSGRGINKELLEELSALGVKALPELTALNSMTDEQLSQYSALYQEKSQLAREQAETELSGMKMDTQVKIEEMRKTANDQLTKLNLEWQTKIKTVTQGTKTELSSLKQIGVDAGNGLLEGLSSTASALYAKAQEIANNIANTIAAALEIHSPSRVTMGFGVNINEGLIKGMEQSSGRLQRALNNVYGSLASSAEKSVASKATTAQTPVSSTTSTSTIENHYHMTFTSPRALDPYETARMAKNALKEMGLQFS